MDQSKEEKAAAKKAAKAAKKAAKAAAKEFKAEVIESEVIEAVLDSEEVEESQEFKAEVIESEVIEAVLDSEEVEESQEFKAEKIEGIKEEEEAKVASESDSVKSLREAGRKKTTLLIGKHEMSSVEDAKCRGAVELHYHTKGLKFRGATLTQETLDDLMKDGDFQRKLGYLRQYVPARKK